MLVRYQLHSWHVKGSRLSFQNHLIMGTRLASFLKLEFPEFKLLLLPHKICLQTVHLLCIAMLNSSWLACDDVIVT